MENKKDNFSRYRSYMPFIFAIILVAGVLLGINLRPDSSTGERKFFVIGSDRYDKLNDVINYVYNSYVDSLSREFLTEETIHSMLRNLDPHSAYIPASEFQRMNDPLQGGFDGIGIEFNMIHDTVMVVNTIAGGPSEKVGLMPGDRIIKVEDEVIAGQGFSTNYIVGKLKGKKGTEVNISVLRRDVSEPIRFTIVRDQIPSFSLDVAYMIDETIGYIRLNKFSATTHAEFLLALETLKHKGMSQLVLDLRGNGGGYMEAAINIADEFLEPKKLIVYTDGQRRPRNYAHARRNGGFENQEVIVLIDEWSASASEIVAGAIQDNDRGLVIGRRSFGKGLVQEQVQLGDGSAMRLTVARYYTPTGRSIQKPYKDGQEEYYNEFLERFHSGELENPESIHFNDSLEFTTPAGRVVYGGGGIMPDIFIPIARDENLAFFNQVSNRGLIYRFAFDYSDRNREQLVEFNNAAELIRRFYITQNTYQKFLDYVSQQGVRPRDNPESRAMITNHLKAYIGRNIFGNEAFFPIVHETDAALKKAVEVFHTNSMTSYLNPKEN
jgi:carboxyl-terminal processing protease